MPRDVYPMQGAETRFAIETSYGVTPGSPTWKRINGLGLMMYPSFEINPFAPPGALVPTSPLVDDDFSEGSLSGVVDFNGLGYPVSSILGWPAITSLGGAPAAYQWLWTWNGRRANRPASFTCHYGYPDAADVATGVVVNTLTISGSRGDGFTVEGDALGKAMTMGQPMGGVTNEVQTLSKVSAPASGSLTLTLDGFTTSPPTAIPWNATAAQIQTALENLPNLDPGDVVVTGGPIQTTPAVITFGGTVAGTDVTLMTVDNSLVVGGTYTMAGTTPGADAVVDVPAIPAGAVTGDVYLDTSFATLGTTQALQVMNMEIAIAERMARVRPINKSKSSDALIDTSDQDHEVTLTLAKNAVSDAQLVKLRAGTFSFIRAQWTGSLISGANFYLFQVDMPIFWQEIGEASDSDGVFTRDFVGRIAIDPTSGQAMRVKLVTGIQSM